jgi:glycosyltransferase involved in cell wall biosynthesis
MKPWHGVDTLVDALADLGGHTSPFRLLLVGHGPRLESVQTRVKELGLEDLVHFPGAVPHEEIPQWLAASDIAMVPYSAQSPPYFSPVKLFECMAMGMPIVASRMGQTEEIVEHERTGWLYDSADPQEPAATLRRLADNPGLWPAAGKAARDRVMAQHTWDASAQCVEQLAERAFKRRRMPGGSSGHISPSTSSIT